MEVPAHTHTARKKWTHYFWEFLMLFLAVDGRGVASVQYSNNGFSRRDAFGTTCCKKTRSKAESRRLGTFEDEPCRWHSYPITVLSTGLKSGVIK